MMNPNIKQSLENAIDVIIKEFDVVRKASGERDDGWAVRIRGVAANYLASAFQGIAACSEVGECDPCSRTALYAEAKTLVRKLANAQHIDLDLITRHDGTSFRVKRTITQRVAHNLSKLLTKIAAGDVDPYDLAPVSDDFDPEDPEQNAIDDIAVREAEAAINQMPDKRCVVVHSHAAAMSRAWAMMAGLAQSAVSRGEGEREWPNPE